MARRAGVGIATLFRRFPTRDDLLAAAFEDKMRAYADVMERAADDPDPWHGFCEYVRTVATMQACDRGFTGMLTQVFPGVTPIEAERHRAYERFVELVERAKATGALRPDFSPEDLPMLLMANAGVLQGTGETAPETSARLVSYLLGAFAAGASVGVELTPPPSAEAMYEAMSGSPSRCR